MDDLGKSFDEYTEKYEMCSETELIEELNTLYLKFVPRDAGMSLGNFLSEGFQTLGIENLDDFKLKDLEYHYKKALYEVTTAHLCFAKNNMLDGEDEQSMDNKIKFNKIFEIIYYLEQSIRSLMRIKIATEPSYDSFMNNDIGLFRFAPIDHTKNSPFQNLILYLLNILQEKGLRRQEDKCMKRVFTDEGYDTHAWEVAFDIKKFIYDVTQKDVNYQQWHNLTSGDNAKKANTYLTECVDAQFRDVVKDRHVFSFKNGIYVTNHNIGTEKEPIYEDRWYPHIPKEENKLSSLDLVSDVTSCKFFDLDFNNFEGVDDWYNIPTPNFQKILDYQEFSEEVCRWMYILAGRMLFEVNELDTWQIMGFFKGRAKSGKSTIINEIIKKIYHTLDVGVLSNNCEKKFGLAALKDKFIFVAPEIKQNFGLEQCDFQTMISGESTSVPEKYKTATAYDWSVPGIMAGNRTPEYEDNQGSISRRLIVFIFKKTVEKGDTQLPKKLSREMAFIIKKCTSAYLEAVRKFGKEDIWCILPKYFKDTKKDIAENTNALQHFFESGKLEFNPEKWSFMTTFKSQFNQHCVENNLGKQKWCNDFYQCHFDSRKLTVHRGMKRKDTYSGRNKTGTWIQGVEIVQDLFNDDDD